MHLRSRRTTANRNDGESFYRVDSGTSLFPPLCLDFPSFFVLPSPHLSWHMHVDGDVFDHNVRWACCFEHRATRIVCAPSRKRSRTTTVSGNGKPGGLSRARTGTGLCCSTRAAAATTGSRGACVCLKRLMGLPSSHVTSPTSVLGVETEFFYASIMSCTLLLPGVSLSTKKNTNKREGTNGDNFCETAFWLS